jgi:hypothetical protein
MGPIYWFPGLTVGFIEQGMGRIERLVIAGVADRGQGQQDLMRTVVEQLEPGVHFATDEYRISPFTPRHRCGEMWTASFVTTEWKLWTTSRGML